MPQGVNWFTRFLREDNNFLDPITNNFDSRNPSYPYTSTFTALFEALGSAFWTAVFSFLGFSLRVKAATDYYVDPSGGNDSNNGSVGAPWRTFAHAMAVIATLDFFGQTVTLHLVNNATETLSVLAWTGGGALVFDGGGKSITTTNADCIDVVNGVTLPGFFQIQNVVLATVTSGSAISFNGTGRIILSSKVAGTPDIIFGACPNSAHIQIVANSAYVQQRAGYTISGAATNHFQISGGTFDGSIFSNTVTTSGNPQFGGNWAFVTGSGSKLIVDSTTYTGTATGYNTASISNNASLIKGGKTLPGNGTISQSNFGSVS